MEIQVQPDTTAEKRPVEDAWWAGIEAVDFAFQPIVSVHSGQCFGYECLLRDVHLAGFRSIPAFFDAAHDQHLLHRVEHRLSERALLKFKGIPHHGSMRLFLNVDNRCFEEVGRFLEPLQGLLRKVDLPATALCLEISEKHPLLGHRESLPALAELRKADVKIALDDFGTGFSGLQALYHAEPDIIKIDRFFIADIANNSKKKIFVTSMVSVAHLLGALVIAEGVETEHDFLACLGTGCDFIQGNFVQPPEQDIGKLQAQYPLVEETARRDRRRVHGDQRLIRGEIEALPPISIETGISTVFDTFRKHTHCTFFPVLNARDEPIGIIHEDALKEYVYSRHGQALLRKHSIREFVTKCPVADVNTRADRILDVFSMNSSAEGVLIVKDMTYLGFLSARSLLRIIHEKNLATARDQNPLSRLPGNYRIHQYLAEAVQDVGNAYMLVYFDFDFFKPFNDYYGFREGDRAIMLFAETLKRKLLDQGLFIGHIGGDDFFVGFRNLDYESAYATTMELVRQFKRDVESLYRPQERQTGYIVTKDREGHLRRFSLLRVSAAILCLPAPRPLCSIEDVMQALAELKKHAKESPDALAAACIRSAPPQDDLLGNAAG